MSEENVIEDIDLSTTETTSTGEVSAEKSSGVLYLGIDLGTSRTSVTASNGIRETVASYVGYPRTSCPASC